MPHQVGPWHRVPKDLNVLKLPSTGAGTLPQAQVSQPCRPAPSRTRGKLRHAHGLTFQDIPGSAMVTAPAVPGVPVGWTSYKFPDCDIPRCMPSERRNGVAC
eukprot:jgi/Tetstr1/422761/TSEL_013558.t1